MRSRTTLLLLIILGRSATEQATRGRWFVDLRDRARLTGVIDQSANTQRTTRPSYAKPTYPTSQSRGSADARSATSSHGQTQRMRVDSLSENRR